MAYYLKKLETIKNKFKKNKNLDKEDIEELLKIIQQSENSIELLNTIIREKRHVIL